MQPGLVVAQTHAGPWLENLVDRQLTVVSVSSDLHEDVGRLAMMIGERQNWPVWDKSGEWLRRRYMEYH